MFTIWKLEEGEDVLPEFEFKRPLMKSTIKEYREISLSIT